MNRFTGLVRRCIEDYGMISDGDEIAVGVSGGKDSLALLCALNNLKGYYPKKFRLHAVTLSMGFEGMDYEPIAELCKRLGIPYTLRRTELGRLIFDERREKNPCALCAKMRRGALCDLTPRTGHPENRAGTPSRRRRGDVFPFASVRRTHRMFSARHIFEPDRRDADQADAVCGGGLGGRPRTALRAAGRPESLSHERTEQARRDQNACQNAWQPVSGCKEQGLRRHAAPAAGWMGTGRIRAAAPAVEVLSAEADTNKEQLMRLSDCRQKENSCESRPGGRVKPGALVRKGLPVYAGRVLPGRPSR